MIALASLLLCAAASPQNLPQNLPQNPPQEHRTAPMRYDQNGWPIVPNEPERRSVVPIRNSAIAAAPAPADAYGDRGDGRAEPAPVMPSSKGGSEAALASGMELGSPLLEVFQFTRSPGAFRALSGQQVWWRVTVLGPQGEVLGMRELTHTVDCGAAERDRIEYEAEGNLFGRSGSQVYAERNGMPWPTDNERAAAELALFGTLFRMPWCFGDAITFVVVGAGTVDRPGERLRSVRIERRPLHGSDLIGPESDPRPRDAFELIYESGTGMPREFVHRFVNSGLRRRVLLEDWRDVGGVRMPFLRIYVDETLRQTTRVEITNVMPQQVHDRMFRLH